MSNPELIEAYGARLTDLQRQKVGLAEKIKNSQRILQDFDITLQTGFQALWKLGKRETSLIVVRYEN